MEVIELNVNLHCKACEMSTRKVISKIKGVTCVDMDVVENKITVLGYVDQKAVVKAVRRTGRRAELRPSYPPQPKISKQSLNSASRLTRQASSSPSAIGSRTPVRVLHVASPGIQSAKKSKEKKNPMPRALRNIKRALCMRPPSGDGDDDDDDHEAEEYVMMRRSHVKKHAMHCGKTSALLQGRTSFVYGDN